MVIKAKDNPDNVLYDLKIYNEGVNPEKSKKLRQKSIMATTCSKPIKTE